MTLHAKVTDEGIDGQYSRSISPLDRRYYETRPEDAREDGVVNVVPIRDSPTILAGGEL